MRIDRLFKSALVGTAIATAVFSNNSHAQSISTGIQTTIENMVLSGIPDPLGDVVNTLRAMPEVSKGGLIVWLNRKSSDAAIAEDFDRMNRYQAFLSCIAVQDCARVEQIQRAARAGNSQAGSASTQSGEALCQNYANTAVDQYDQNLKRGCGFSGRRWQINWHNHYGWCMQGNGRNGAAASEQNARTTQLRQCGGGSAATGQFVRTANAGIPGYNTETHSNVSLGQCQSICIQRTWCKSIDFERAVGRCYVQPVGQNEKKLRTNYPGHPYDHYTLSGR